MTQLTIVADIRADPDRVDLVAAELEKLVRATRAEAGCLQYDLHRDNDDPAHFLFYENWESREHWEAHMESAHIAAYREAVRGAILELELYDMTLVE